MKKGGGGEMKAEITYHESDEIVKLVEHHTIRAIVKLKRLLKGHKVSSEELTDALDDLINLRSLIKEYKGG